MGDLVKLRNQKILFYGALLIFFLAAYQFIPFEPTNHDLDIAAQIVEKRYHTPCWGQAQANGEILVYTGGNAGPIFHLRRIFWRWWIYKTEDAPIFKD